MSKEKNHGRALDKKHLSLVLPVDLFEKIERIKDCEQRNRNNLIVRLLTQEVERYEKQQTDRMAADKQINIEERPTYGLPKESSKSQKSASA